MGMANRQENPGRVARRSCDQCRARKIGCDRGSPCAPCVSARLPCTHSAVASSSTGPSKRVLISTQYEQKIDGIARDIDGIKQLLQGLNLSGVNIHSTTSSLPTSRDRSTSLREDVEQFSGTDDEVAWGHSMHMIDFLRAMVRDGASRATDHEADEVLSSLKRLLKKLESPSVSVNIEPLQNVRESLHMGTTLPPQDSVVAVLRWAKEEHTSNTRLQWLAQLLPLERFTEICQNIYFSVDGYSEVEFILANGYLSYVFFEYLIVSGRSDYVEHSKMCRSNLNLALSRLPLLLRSSMEAVAALTLGAYNAVEDSKARAAWTFISTASNHCLTLGYHRLQPYRTRNQSLIAAQERLFWAVYRLDKGISLRLGRASSIRDEDISLSPFPGHAGVRTARVQGQAWNELYSPKGLMREDAERAYIAKTLAAELQQCVLETQAAVSNKFDGTTPGPSDSLGKLYMKCELICQYSLLTLVLRAVPAPVGSMCSIPNECLLVARKALRAHEECIVAIKSCTNQPLMLARYVNWAIVHCPFPPFSILLTHAIQLMDTTELTSLERFAASLEPPGCPVQSDQANQPWHLYRLLCRAARLYLNYNTESSHGNTCGFQMDTFGDVSFTDQGTDIGLAPEPEHPESWLGEWFNGNQLVMSVLDESLLF